MLKFKYINFIISLFLVILVQTKAHAFQITDNQTVDATKTWTIKFTSNVGFDTSTRQGITVTDNRGNKVNVSIQLGDDDNTIIVTAPQGGYTAGESYILNIGTKTHSSKGTALKNEYKLHFNIKDDNSVVTFKDANLEKVVRDAINKPTGDIYKSDVEKITKLNANGKNIQDITGIENLGNLQTLNLGPDSTSNSISYNCYNQIININPLKNLTNLQYLDLSFNQIVDITPLQGLNNLQLLSLCKNQISDVSPLQRLTNLQNLILYENKISNISSLKGLTNLQVLSLSRNQINDISALNSLNNLQDLGLSETQVTNISALIALTNLQNLSLDDNRISNINPLKNLTNLKTLFLMNNQISDISALQGLNNLYYIDLRINQISNIYALNGLTNLRSLFLESNLITDYSPVKGYYNNLTNKDFELTEDIIKPYVISVYALADDTIRVRFNKDIDAAYGRNPSNYKLKDSNGIDITYEIESIKIAGDTTSSISSTGSALNIELGNDSSGKQYKLIDSQYTITIENIQDTASPPNVMDDYKTTFNIED